jgi:hypothetical protein
LGTSDAERAMAVNDEADGLSKDFTDFTDSEGEV